MALSQSPPPFFYQGVSGRSRLFIAVLCSVGLMQIDRHLELTSPLRQGLSVLLHPIVELLQLPRDMTHVVLSAVRSAHEMQREIDDLKQKQVADAARLVGLARLEAENASLRGLLELRARINKPTVVAEFQAAQRDPFANRIIINQGTDRGLTVGDPVLSSDGVIGQVSRAYPLTSEVRLVSDEQLIVPVFLPRVGVRAIAQGLGGQDTFELQYVNLAADIHVGDKIITSGLDGRYPPGLPVGEVISIIPGREGQFPRVLAKPAVSIADHQQLLVIRHQP